MIYRLLAVMLCMISMIGLEAQEDPDKKLHGDLDTVDIVYHPVNNHFNYNQNALHVQSQSRELAATFEDPSRVLYRHAGISLANDQNNSIVYRGIPSEFIRWSFSGAEVVNPNHLNNAGRLSDESSPSSGGVLAIPFDVISQFSFYGNPYTGTQANAMSGVSDFAFDRKGDNFFKFGLLGMEAGFQSEGNVNTKAHLRYSTVGLLSDLGVDFDGEKIKFYDAFSKTNIGKNLSLIFSAGKSTNNKTAVADTTEIEEYKDLQNIDYSSDYLIGGIRFNTKKFEQVAFFSKSESERRWDLGYEIPGVPTYPDQRFYKYRDRFISYKGQYRFIMPQSVFRLYWSFNYHENEMVKKNFTFGGREFAGRVALSYDRSVELGDFVLKLNPEIAHQYNFSYTNEFRWEPSAFASISYNDHSLLLNYSKKYRSPRISSFEDQVSNFLDDNESYSVSYQYKNDDHDFNFMTRLYDMRVTVPHLAIKQFLYGFSNISPSNVDLSQLDITDIINSRGVEFIADKSWKGNWYSNVNFSLLDALYEKLDLETEENFGYVLNIALSKEYSLKNSKRLFVNMAYHQRGGAYQVDFDALTGDIDQSRLSAYKRADLRLQLESGKNIWVLDIQNFLGLKNDAYYFYDAYLDEDVLQEQLAMIPILSYRRNL